MKHLVMNNGLSNQFCYVQVLEEKGDQVKVRFPEAKDVEAVKANGTRRDYWLDRDLFDDEPWEGTVEWVGYGAWAV